MWGETIEAHRREVRDAILDAAGALLAERGLTAVTMSDIAETTGIARATLYKYFPSVETILVAWHDRQVMEHLDQLRAVADRGGHARERLESVLETYALIAHEYHGHDLATVVHRQDHDGGAQHQLRDLVRRLIDEAVASGEVRADTPSNELAAYCVRALSAAGDVPSKAAVRRLVAVTMAGLCPTD